MKKRCLALLLCAVMVFSLAACGNKDDKKDEPSTTTQGDGQNQEEKQDPDEQEEGNDQDDAQTGDDTAQGGDGVTLPLTADKKELSFWIVWSFQYLDNPNEIERVKQMEEETNVHINWVTVNTTEAQEKFGLMIASGDVPDMVKATETYYPGGLEKSVEDGVFLDCTDLVANYMPNYEALRSSDEYAKKGTTTDSGNLVAVYTLNGTDTELQKEMAWDGILLREDWLKDCGLEAPVTIDDWHTVLTAFKEQKGAEAPLLFAADGTYMYGAFLSAWNMLPEFYQQDGAVKFGPAEPGYKEYVETMRQWYAEGLIDQNFMTNDGTMIAPNDYLATGKSGAGVTLWGYAADALYTDYKLTTDPNYYLIGVNNPVLNEGDQSYCGYPGSTIGNAVSISATCKEPELAAKWLDYQYTQDCMIKNTYGEEGKTFVTNDDGSHSFTELITNNPDGYGNADALSFYTLHTGANGWYNWERFTSMYDPKLMACQYIWDEDSTDLVIPTQVTMTDEEGTEYNSYYTSIQTLVNEMTTKFILGTESMDNYDDFVQKQYDYGLQTCIDIKQAALDRYNAR